MANTAAVEITASDTMNFESLVHEHKNRVFSIAYHFLRDSALAEEVAQDVFLKLYRKLSSLESSKHINAWLYKVTSHRCIDYARRRRRELALDEIPEPASENTQRDPLIADRLGRMVASLPHKSRIVVVLRYQEELKPEEIAIVLGWRLNTVKSQLQRSLKILRRKLGPIYGEVTS
jgi:RNA polymerase sigma-70 factor (ECF subfamily)